MATVYPKTPEQMPLNTALELFYVRNGGEPFFMPLAVIRQGVWEDPVMSVVAPFLREVERQVPRGMTQYVLRHPVGAFTAVVEIYRLSSKVMLQLLPLEVA